MLFRSLGQPFDIHGGGRDLIFPHHENEIAQSEAAFGLPLARAWIHNGFLNIDQEKMSKSLGNFFTIQEILSRREAAALRHYFLSSHYRSPVDFSDQALEEAEKGVERIYETVERFEHMQPGSLDGGQPDAALLEEFRNEMDDDFNTPRALALVFEEVRSLNRAMDERKASSVVARALAVARCAEVLGLLQERPEAFLARKKRQWTQRQGLSSEWIEETIQRRDQARRQKQWSEADRIRAELQQKGITLEDTPGGTLWKVR